MEASNNNKEEQFFNACLRADRAALSSVCPKEYVDSSAYWSDNFFYPELLKEGIEIDKEKLSKLVEKADNLFEGVGGGTMGWVRECFLPLLCEV